MGCCRRSRSPICTSDVLTSCLLLTSDVDTSGVSLRGAVALLVVGENRVPLQSLLHRRLFGTSTSAQGQELTNVELVRWLRLNAQSVGKR